MAIFYVDPEGGNNNNSGDSFAVALAAADGIVPGVTSTTLNSATGGFTGALIGRTIHVFGGSINVTRIITAVNTSNQLIMNAIINGGTYNYVIGGRLAGPPSPITSGVAAGDEIRFIASPDPVDTTIQATWTDLSKTLTLSEPVSEVIDNVEANWTLSANVTQTSLANSAAKQNVARQFSIAAGFTTGKAAYSALPGATDLSAYTRVSLWCRVATRELATGEAQIRLCSDAVGDVAVNTFTLPLQSISNQWRPIVLDNAGPLGASIQSVALYIAADNGAIQIGLDNILACLPASDPKAITHLTMIGKPNSIGVVDDHEEGWYTIQSMVDDVILIDNQYQDTMANSGRGYSGVSETVDLWTWEPIPVYTTFTNAGVEQSYSNQAGMTITGGWNRTDMSTVTGLTILDARSTRTYMGTLIGATTERIGGCRFPTMFNCSGWYTSHFKIPLITGARFINTSDNCIVEMDYCLNWDGFAPGIVNSNIYIFKRIANMQSSAYDPNNGAVTLIGGDVVNCLRVAFVDADGEQFFKNIACRAQANEDFRINSEPFSDKAIINCSSDKAIASSIVFQTATAAGLAKIRVERFNNQEDQNYIYTATGRISTVIDSNRHTNSGFAWRFEPTQGPALSSGTTKEFALQHKIAQILVEQGTPVTVSIWFKKSSASAAGGIRALSENDVIQTYEDYWVAEVEDTGIVNTYEQLQMSWTPEKTGVVDIFAFAYATAASTSCWFDDMEVEA